MIWLKRVLPLVIIVLIWQGLSFYNRHRESTRRAADLAKAEATARIWVASARYRNDPARYIAYRDSVLDANGLTAEDMFDLIKRVKDDPEGLMPFTQGVMDYVDSFSKMEENFTGPDSLPPDSILPDYSSRVKAPG